MVQRLTYHIQTFESHRIGFKFYLYYQFYLFVNEDPRVQSVMADIVVITATHMRNWVSALGYQSGQTQS